MVNVLKNNTENFGFKRKSGILMPVISLPSAYGIGSFGKSAYEFIDFLSECGQKCWQVLPLNPTSYGDSPYQSPSSKAGNPYFIDLDILKEEGLLTLDELKEVKVDHKKVDYGWLFYSRYSILRRAYGRFEPDAKYNAFCRKNAHWLEDHSLFMALKVKHNYTPWTEWGEEYRNVKLARASCREHKEEMNFQKWVQYEFFKQWKAIRDYAKSKKIVIIGDTPIYVAHDSVDVWASPEQFLLDEKYMPTLVAGCPPDAYAEDGQLWGNPIYDWDKMKEDGFSWWIDRVSSAFEMYDILRIDHFRGFASFFAIPYGDKNARGGSWKEAPGIELFNAIKAALPKSKIIAEDLGFITDDVRELLAETGFPGMKVLQFAFYNDNSEYLPKTYTTDNCVVYSGSHDADCTKSWYGQLSEDALKRFKKECPRAKGQSATEATIALAMKSRANLCVIPMQDYLELTNSEGRMNTPSTATGNWSWRVSSRYATEKLKNKIRTLTEEGKRV